MSHRSVPCPAHQMTGQLAGITSVLAAGAVSAHMQGVAAARQAREDRASHILAYQVDEAAMVAREWADYAKRLIVENENLKAENERLRLVAVQRRGTIERLAGQLRSVA